MDAAAYTPEQHAVCSRCIWSNDPDGLAAAEPCDPATWAGAIKAERDALGPQPELDTRPGPLPPYLRCAAVLMVKNEADIIGANLRWLYHGGVRRFAVIDNGSTDATWAELQRFQSARTDVELLAVQDPIVRHIQAEKVSGLCHLARSVWPDLDWFLPMDADEFLVTRFGLRALLAVPDEVDALTIQKMVHFRPRGAAQPSTGPSFAGMTVRCLPFMLPAKVVLRARRDLDVTQGNHAVTVPGRASIYAGALQYGFFIREFRTRSFAQFLGKVRQGGAAILAARAAGRDPGGDQWLAWHEILLAGGEDALRAEYDLVAFREHDSRHVTDEFSPVA